ncbi:MAG: hypothetical protein APF77_05490 [Clostridia bacterium BRH_c25]|nr:MAG: hypothetical protein APF77_05490 [Clostridia bacterium BRH_c25]
MSYNYIERHDIFASLYGSNETNMVDGKGALLIDENGKEYIDFNETSIFLGQRNENFDKKIKKAFDEITSSKGNKNHYKNRLFEMMIETTNHDFDRIFLASSGSEAMEWSLRLAKKMTGRCEALSFWNSIHGRTYLSSSSSGYSTRKTGHGPIAPGVVYGVYPNCSHCEFNCQRESCNFYCLDFLDRKIENESTQDISAVIVEPYQGAGIICPPKGYLKALRQWTKDRGILLIFDEIQAGLGRTGELYCYQQEGIVPDMLLLGKGLGNGLHIAALLIKGDVSKEEVLALYGGSGDSSISCAAACAVYEELLETDLLENVKKVSDYLYRALRDNAKKYSFIYEVRGMGLALAIEFCGENKTEQIAKCINALYEMGFIVGKNSNSIVLRPPLSLTLEQAKSFDSSLSEICSQIL